MRGRSRLWLSLICEAGDPRLREALSGRTPDELVDRLRAGDPQLPQQWRHDIADAERRADEAQAAAERSGLRWLTPGHPQWPAALDDLADAPERGGCAGAPLGLWVRGQASPAELTEAAVAVVGARQCTTYGAECAHDIAADCADAGVTVVSGAAFGIDACAHRGALLADGPTIAVLACGADVDYPRAHAALLHRIAETGLVISEQPPGSAAQKHRFLSRNRLIAALSAGTVVVEAARRSGSLNTLRWADQLSRVSMVVPGPVTSQLSGGCHEAVRSGEAVLVIGAQDVLQEAYGVETQSPVGGLPISARRVWTALGHRPMSVAGLATQGRMGTRDALRGLELLRAAGLAERIDEERTWVRATGL